MSDIEDETQKQVILYAMRFRETVFVHDLAQDVRFLNAPSPRSVLCLPILQSKQTLGVLYLVRSVPLPTMMVVKRGGEAYTS